MPIKDVVCPIRYGMRPKAGRMLQTWVCSMSKNTSVLVNEPLIRHDFALIK